MPNDLQTRGPRPFPQMKPRQIYTAPSKSGGYGTPGLWISDVGAEYIATIYDQPRINAKQEREAWRKRISSVPFKPVGRQGYTFDEGLATGASMCYAMTRPFMAKPVQQDMKHFVIDKLWLPPGCIPERPPPVEYWEDPYNGFDPRVDPKSRLKKPSDSFFKTGFRGDNFFYTQSIVFKRL
ncbi:unnamed protein product [Trypanosoma congolense IL3000]|nr:unnamed protein product [Trypanosoma congolense IL3000]